jgi:BON domain
MPQISNPFSKAAKTAAQGLRIGASVLEQLGGGSDSEQAPEQQERRQQQAAPARAQKPARRGTARRPQASNRPKDLDDVTIARKVETELFRDRDVPKGDIDVNVADGVVFLRGQVKHPDDVKRLEAQAQAIPEVKGVENLLHLPKTPAPTRADTPDRQQKPTGRRTKPRSAQVKPAPRTVHTEVPTPGAEPSPNETARTRAGRRPAPLGSRGTATTNGEGETPKATPPSERSVDTVEKDPEPAKRA